VRAVAEPARKSYIFVSRNTVDRTDGRNLSGRRSAGPPSSNFPAVPDSMRSRNGYHAHRPGRCSFRLTGPAGQKSGNSAAGRTENGAAMLSE